MRFVFGLIALSGCLACTPQGIADDITRRAAMSVVTPVMERDMPSPAAARATECITRNASPSELEALARDVGVVAGTLTEANIRSIALRPATQACLTASGIVLGQG